MTQHIVPAPDIEGPVTRIREDGTIEVPSFHDPATRYDVRLMPLVGGTCSCPRYEVQRACMKHPALARAVSLARQRRWPSVLVEHELFALCAELFAPQRVLEKVTPLQSYDLLQRTLAYPHTTPEMRDQAFRQHHRVLLLHAGEGR